VPAYISYLGFKSEIESRAAQAVQNSGTTEDKLKAGLQDKAAELGVPLESGNLSVQLGDHSAHIVATWSPEVRFLAGRMVRRIHFTVDVVR
jgi:hypothetical protein